MKKVKQKRSIQTLQIEAQTQMVGAPKGIRIPVFSLKGWCPRPLDDGGSSIKDKQAAPQALSSQESQTLYSYFE